MAVITNNIVTSFMARGGNAIATMGQVSGSIMNIGKSASSTTRQFGAMDKQMQAFKTTLRYAFAGSVIFGVTTMIGKLSQLQQQMGLISAIAGPAGVNLTGGTLSKFEDEIANKSVYARTNINDLNDSVINFLSTVQGANQREIPEIVSQIGIAAKLSQTPTEDLTKAVTTLNIAAGRKNNLENINALLREWYHLISTVPGGISAAPMIAQQLGPLAAIAQAGQLSPEQLFGFSTGALRFGATPSTALRGTQYFLQSLLMPKGKQAEALASAGFTPQRMLKEGGARFILDYLRHLQSLGAKPTTGQVRRFGNLVDQNPDTEAELDPNQNIPGIQPGALKFLNATIGRIHGVRTALVLLRQLESHGQVSSLNDVIKSLYDIQQGVGKDAKELQRSADRYRQSTPLQAAAIALDSLRTNVARDISPVLNPIAGGIADVGHGLSTNKNARHIAEISGAALIAALGVKKIFGSGGFNLLGAGGSALVAANAAHAAASTDLEIGHTPQNPIYVTVVGQLFGGRGGVGGGGTVVGGATEKPPRFLPLGLGGAALFAVTATLASAGSNRLRTNTGAQFFMGSNQAASKKAFPNLFSLMNTAPGQAFRTEHKGIFEKALKSTSPEQLVGLERELTRQLRIERRRDNGGNVLPEALLKGLNKPGGLFSVGGWTADGEIILNIKLNNNGKITEKRISVPAGLHSGGKSPTSRGKRKTVKSDFTLPWIGGK